MEKVRAGHAGGIRPIFISDYLQRHGAHGWVTVEPGAWNTGTGFVQWTGSPAQQQALTRVGGLSEAVHAARRNAIAIGAGSPDLYRNLEDALALVLRAETSCNFNWGKPGCNASTTTSTKPPSISRSRKAVLLTTTTPATRRHYHNRPADTLTSSRPNH
jgi:alpha-amylase/alpha-mannosidase (GH57 family)